MGLRRSATTRQSITIGNLISDDSLAGQTDMMEAQLNNEYVFLADPRGRITPHGRIADPAAVLGALSFVHAYNKLRTASMQQRSVTLMRFAWNLDSLRFQACKLRWKRSRSSTSARAPPVGG